MGFLPARKGQRRTLDEPLDLLVGCRTFFRADVPRRAFRHFFATVIVGHEDLKTWRPPISHDFERGLRLVASADDEWSEQLKKWQEEGRSILKDYGRYLEQRRDPRGRRLKTLGPKGPGPKFITDSSEESLLLRTFGGYLTLADRTQCTRDRFFSTVFPAMVKASKIDFYLPAPRSLDERVRRAGGDAQALRYADGHISILHPDLKPFRFRSALSGRLHEIARRHFPKHYSD
jgi:hypothetical protein